MIVESVPGEERNSMYSHVISGTTFGIQGMLIQVEADVSDGLPGFHLVGCLSNEIRESSERIRTAMRNSGCYLPPKRIVVNLSPADVRKAGSGFDLPIAIATLISMEMIPQERVEGMVMIGELGLNGSILPVNGVLSIADCVAKAGYQYLIVAKENQMEAAMVETLRILPVESLRELIDLLNSDAIPSEKVYRSSDESDICYDGKADELADWDFGDLKGQPLVRRAMEIAASGMHNILMSGPPGSGKSLAAKCLTGILPNLTREERMELTKIYSVKGLLSKQGSMLQHRPFRAPHHTISTSALVGGGVIPKPGEISLAHNGILFLDELPEFSRNAIEVLRQPLEDGKVLIGRMNQTFEFPANVMLVGAMNPCPCGCYPDRSRCNCSVTQIQNYQGKISRAILDRMDIHLSVLPISYEEMVSKENWENSAAIRERVERTHAIQRKRYREQGILFNSQLSQDGIKRYCGLDETGESFMQEIYERHQLSGRAYFRILKLARTIADMEEATSIQLPHLQEAVAYRLFEHMEQRGGEMYGR